MTIEAYINPDFTRIQKIIFFVMAIAGLVGCIALIVLSMKISTSIMKKSERDYEFYERSHNRVQRFYEMIISGTAVISFSCAYVVINHIYSLYGTSSGGMAGIVERTWADWKDFILLLLICLSCVFNTLLDKLIIPLKKVSKEEKASIRLLAMFYVIIILVWLNRIGDESEYNPVMMYYLGLMIGRFVYFDASFRDFFDAIKNALLNLPLLVMGLALTGALSYAGFSLGYLLERNYYIVGVFYTNLFLLAATFVIHNSRILSLIVRAPKENKVKVLEDDDFEEM